MCKEVKGMGELADLPRRSMARGDLTIFDQRRSLRVASRECNTFNADMTVRVSAHRIGICLLIDILIPKLITIFVVASGIALEDCSLITSMDYPLGIRISLLNLRSTNTLHLFVNPQTVWSIKLTLVYILSFAFKLAASVRGPLNGII